MSVVKAPGALWAGPPPVSVPLMKFPTVNALRLFAALLEGF